MPVDVLIAGDTCPFGKNKALFQHGDAQGLLQDLLPEFEQADLRIVNLECPLIEAPSPIPKSGPHLDAPVSCVNGLKAMGVDVACVANNHILDHGEKGMESTLSALRNVDIDRVGAGAHLEEARSLVTREISGIRIGIMAVAEDELCAATQTTPGANPLDPIELARTIRAFRKDLDHLIVIVHGGMEYFPYPPPQLLKVCRFAVESGASAVICQHTHCAGCMEIYEGAPIIYGQGNFIFDYPHSSPDFLRGLLVVLRLEKDSITHRLIPFLGSEESPGVRKMDSEEALAYMQSFEERSTAIADDAFLLRQWEQVCGKQKRFLLHLLHGRPGLLRRILGKFDLLHLLDSEQVRRQKLHLFRCETYREALTTVLGMEVGRPS